MKGTAILFANLCAALALCQAAAAATGQTAILIEEAKVYKSAQDVIATLPAGAKVAVGKTSGQWVAVSWRTKEEVRQGWVERAKLEAIQEGFDAAVSQHCVLHAQDPAYIERFDLKITENLYAAVARSLINRPKEEPPFNPDVKLRIYLFNRKTYANLAKRYRQSPDDVGFVPLRGQVYLEYSLRTTTTPMKALIVHELAVLVLRDYANQPRNRRGVGGPLPLWLVQGFATYHELLAGFNTDNLIYVSDKPKLATLVNKTSMPSKEKDRDKYLATAGTLGHMLLNHGTTERFSGLVRALQAGAGRARPDAIMLQHYGLTRTKFQDEWARYVDVLKDKYGIRKREDELDDREDEDEPRDPRDRYDFMSMRGNFERDWVNKYLARRLPPSIGPADRRSLVSRILAALSDRD
jgi:hypothetical protein